MRTLLYRNFRLLILCMVLILCWGCTAFQGLPRLEDPELTERAAIVQTFLPGASADRLESLVTEKLENQLDEVEEIVTHQSTSRAGISTIMIELDESLNAEKVDGVWSRVRDRLKAVSAELPPDTTEPELDIIQVRAYALLVGITWDQDDTPNQAILRRRALALMEQLRTLPGTERVDIFGEPEEEVAVTVAPSQLASLGLSIQQLANQLQQSDVKASAGQLRDRNELALEVSGSFRSLEQLRQIPVRCDRCQSSQTGQFATLGDIAQIGKGMVEPPSSLSQVSDRPAVVIGVYIEPEYRLDRWTSQAKEVLTQFESQLPSGIGLQTILEQNHYVSARLDQLFSSLRLGALLLFGVTFLMMGFQASIVIQLTLGLTVLIVFGLMELLNIPLHQMSVMGLIVSLGLLIDNAIIVVDDIYHRLRSNPRPQMSVHDSISYLASPLIAGTLTTVLAFMPIALLSGNLGEFMGTLGLNVILAVLASLVIALTITPVLAARLYCHWVSRPFAVKRLSGLSTLSHQGYFNVFLARCYERTLHWTLARPLISILLSLWLPLSGFWVVTTLDLQLFPTAERDQMELQIELPLTQSLAETQAMVAQVRDRLIQYSEIEDIHWFLGESSPRIYYNQIGNREAEPSYANGIVQLSERVTHEWITQTQRELDQAFPSSRILLLSFEQGPPFNAPIELRIYGPDLDVLQSLGEQARDLLLQLPEVSHTRALIGESLPQLFIQVDEAAARSRGLSQAAIAQQLNLSLEGMRGGSLIEGSEELPVRVRLANTDRANLDQIATLNLVSVENTEVNRFSKGGTTIPLDALATLMLEPKRSAITHRNGLRVNTVQGYLTSGTLPANVFTDFQQLLNQSIMLPAGYSLEVGGEAEQRHKAVKNLLSTVGFLAILLVATLVVALNSFRLAGIISAVAVLSIGLSFLAVWIWEFPFGFNSLIGTVGLVGVAVNDSIAVLTALKSDPAASRGDLPAMRRVVMQSTRHILTTTFTTIVGFAPLIWGGGTFWPPLAVAISGGVVGTTVLALYFVPSVYRLIVKPKRPEIVQNAVKYSRQLSRVNSQF